MVVNHFPFKKGRMGSVTLSSTSGLVAATTKSSAPKLSQLSPATTAARERAGSAASGSYSPSSTATTTSSSLPNSASNNNIAGSVGPPLNLSMGASIDSLSNSAGAVPSPSTSNGSQPSPTGSGSGPPKESKKALLERVDVLEAYANTLTTDVVSLSTY